jgi:Rrf2 family cysteine metabolism transcriptional repressor
MRLSTRARYGLRAAVDLAENYEGSPLSMAEIAERHGISRKYLHAILSLLKTAGYVRSERGTTGGYALSRKPSEIRVIDILEALEGSVTLVDCVHDASLCERAELCVTREVWRDLSKAIRDVLSGSTLQDLVVRSRERRDNHPEMYHI